MSYFEDVEIKNNTSGNKMAVNSDGSINVDINNSPIPVSQSGSWTVSLTSESIEIGTVDQGTAAALSGAWPVEVTDGTNILGTSSHPVRTDPTGTTTQPVSISGTVPVSGTVAVTQSTSPWVVSGTVTSNAGTGTFTVGQSTGTNLHTVLDSGTLTSITNALPAGTNVIGHVIADSGSTTAVTGNVTVVQGTGTNLHTVVDSGTITANIGTSGSLALDATVSGLEVSQGSTTSGQKGILELGAVTTSAPSYTTGQTNPLSLTTAGALRTDSSATTQPVSGTVTANAGSGTFSVSGTVTANAGTGTFLVDGSAHTQPVSGTVTANIGTSGSLALDATVAKLTLSQGSTTSTQTGPLIQGAVTTSAPSYTTAQTSPLSLTTLGALRTDSSATTQPISGTVTSNIGTTNGLALDTTLTGGTQQTKIVQGGNTAVVDATGDLQVDVNNFPATQAVTQSGTWTVQPGNTPNTTPWLATINQGGNSATVTASNALKVDGSAVTQPVSGTVTANAGTGNFTVVQAIAANLNATVVGPTLTKGTQGSTGFAVQELKDAGRTYVTFTSDAIAGQTAETLLTMTQNRQGSTTSANNYTITSGKTLRIQSITVGVQSGAGAGEWVRVKLRHNTAGATTTSSTLVYTVACGTSQNQAAIGGQVSATIPDGLEIFGDGTQTIGISHISSAITNVESITICGYEY